MSETRTWSAGGKLFVSGEYAVLWGGVARLVAVGPRVEALAQRREDGLVELLLPGRRLAGAATPAGVRWREEPDQDFRFVAHALDLALRAAPGPVRGLSAAFAPSPTVGGLKLGLGSSARATMLAAEAARWGLEAGFDSLKLALVAHAEAQGGRGSGGDVAAICAGGTVAYRRYEVGPALAASTTGGLEAALGRGPPVALVREPPPALGMVYLFTGQSASTPALIGRAEQGLAPGDRPAFVERSDALSGSLQAALTRGDAPVAREVCQALQSHLDRLTGGESAALQRVLQLAAAFGCAAKQSGAGGGDGCLAFAPDPDAARALLEAAEARGLYARAVEPAEGLRTETGSASTLSTWVTSSSSLSN
jgi:phosphomevalonate kinase